MTGDTTVILGIEIPSTDPVFITVIMGIHVPLGLACVVAGAAAMLSEKRRGHHSTAGKVYYWCLLALFASMTFLSVMRWAENYHLFIIGALSFASAFVASAAGPSSSRHAPALSDRGRKATSLRTLDGALIHSAMLDISPSLRGIMRKPVPSPLRGRTYAPLTSISYWLLASLASSPSGIPCSSSVALLCWHPLVRQLSQVPLNQTAPTPTQALIYI